MKKDIKTLLINVEEEIEKAEKEEKGTDGIDENWWAGRKETLVEFKVELENALEVVHL